MAMASEELYLQLGTLVEEMPDLATGPITNDVNRWLGRAVDSSERPATRQTR